MNRILFMRGAGECAGIVEGKVGVDESMVRRKVKWKGRGG
jgi:hypothetical protein